MRGKMRRFDMDERWRIVATFEDTNATPTRRVIHHGAGLAGMGGSSYIDSVILSAPHANNDTADAALETRFYPLQNWRADVVCVGRLGGGGFQLVEVVDYDTYGNAISRPAACADFDGNGGVDGADLAAWLAAYEVGDSATDVDLNGGIDGGDLGLWFDVFESGVSGPSRGACTNSGVIAGYAGYVRDRWAPDLYHVRHRVYDTRMGTWTKRDPLGYVDGIALYAYCRLSPIVNLDSDGRLSTRCPLIDRIRVVGDRWPEAVGFKEHPLLTCATDPLVMKALVRYYADCAKSARGRVRITYQDDLRPSVRGEASCDPNEITLGPKWTCATLAHELLHAADFCATDDNCSKRSDDAWRDSPDVACKAALCVEARALAYINCCDPADRRRQVPDGPGPHAPRDWRGCIDHYKGVYTMAYHSYPPCSNVPLEDLERAWDECLPENLDESSACGRSIPRAS